MPSVERSDPPYQQIMRHIEAQIDSGALAPGDAIPSARVIAEQWSVAHATASKVIALLRSKGLIETTPRGSFVAAPTSGTQAYARSVMTRGTIYPEGHFAVIHSAELVSAPDHIADVFGIEAGASVIRRERVTFAPDEAGANRPQSTSVSWFDGSAAEAAPLLLMPERIRQGTTQYLADQTGRGRSPRENNKVGAWKASNHEAARLEIQPGDPVLRGRVTYWDLHGSVLEYGESSKRSGVEESYDYIVESEQST